MVTINTFWASSDIEAAARPGNGKLGLVAGISNKHGTAIKRLGIDGNKFVCQSGQALPCSALRGEGCAIYRWYRWSQAIWWTWEKKENVLLFLHIAADLLIQILMITMTPKEEVNRNYFVHYSDISDIFKDFVDNNGVSSCLKSLWKTRLCKFHLNVLTSSQSL